MNSNRISVIGLGKLGACTAACFAAKGYEVIGVDSNAKFVDMINKGAAPVVEPRLQELMDQAGSRLKASASHADAVRDSNITFLIVPTPSLENGDFSNACLISSIEPLAHALRESGKPYHLFVITSTVTPGTSREVIIPLIESITGRELNRGFGLCYNPEFISLGSVINDFLGPDMVLIGESDEFAGEQLAAVYRRVCENRPFIARMSLVSSEITKISLNSYVTMKISFANTLSRICGGIPGADVDHITTALGADRRIGPHYLKGGLSFGGPCFPRDNRAFAAFAAKTGTDAHLAKATDSVNRDNTVHIAKEICHHARESCAQMVAVLGLSYKPNTPVIEESPAVAIIEELLRCGLKVVVYDPLAMEQARRHFGPLVTYAGSARECFDLANVCVITTQAAAFAKIDDSYIKHSPTTVIDCWRLLDPEGLGEKVRYFTIGRTDPERAGCLSR